MALPSKLVTNCEMSQVKPDSATSAGVLQVEFSRLLNIAGSMKAGGLIPVGLSKDLGVYRSTAPPTGSRQACQGD